MRYTLKKYDRLTLNKDIQQVFEQGKSISLFPLKLVYYIEEKNNLHHVQCGFLVSKRYFIRAHKRNSVKRLMKTCYRLQKHQIASEKHLKMMLLYTHKEIIDYQEMFEKMKKIFSILMKKI